MRAYHVMCALCFCLLSTQAADYPPGFVGWDDLSGRVYRGNNQRTGVYPASGLPSLSGERWSFKTGASVVSSPVVVDGTVYVGSGDKNLYAIDLASGEKKWSYKSKGAVHASPAVLGGMVYCMDVQGNVFALKTDSGEKVWSSKIRSKGNGYVSPAIAYGLVFISGGSTSGLEKVGWSGEPPVGLDVLTGAKDWEMYKGKGPQVLASLTLTPEKMFFRHQSLCLKSGRTSPVASPSRYLSSSWDSAYATTCAPAYSDGYLVLNHQAAGDGSGLHQIGNVQVVPIDAKGKGWAATLWEPANAYPVAKAPEDGKNHACQTSPTVVDGTIYVGCNDQTLYTFKLKDGKRGWTFKTGGPIKSCLSYAAGVLYFGCHDGKIYAVDAESGQERWTHKAGGEFLSSPYPADGAIVIGCMDGRVIALE